MEQRQLHFVLLTNETEIGFKFIAFQVLVSKTSAGVISTSTKILKKENEWKYL